MYSQSWYAEIVVPSLHYFFFFLTSRLYEILVSWKTRRPSQCCMSLKARQNLSGRRHFGIKNYKLKMKWIEAKARIERFGPFFVQYWRCVCGGREAEVFLISLEFVIVLSLRPPPSSPYDFFCIRPWSHVIITWME